MVMVHLHKMSLIYSQNNIQYCTYKFQNDLLWMPDILLFPLFFDPHKSYSGIEDWKVKSVIRALISRLKDLHIVTTCAFVLSICFCVVHLFLCCPSICSIWLPIGHQYLSRAWEHGISCQVSPILSYISWFWWWSATRWAWIQMTCIAEIHERPVPWWAPVLGSWSSS